MSLKQRTAGPPDPPVARATYKESPADGGEYRRIGTLLVLIGALLMSLAAGDALASAAREEGVAPSSSAQGGWLVGSRGEDKIWGLDGDDTLYGGEGDDELYGGPGQDVLFGGAGDDFVETKDGERDYVECGGGYDDASVDARDRVAPSCETRLGP